MCIQKDIFHRPLSLYQYIAQLADNGYCWNRMMPLNVFSNPLCYDSVLIPLGIRVSLKLVGLGIITIRDTRLSEAGRPRYYYH